MRWSGLLALLPNCTRPLSPFEATDFDSQSIADKGVSAKSGCPAPCARAKSRKAVRLSIGMQDNGLSDRACFGMHIRKIGIGRQRDKPQHNQNHNQFENAPIFCPPLSSPTLISSPVLFSWSRNAICPTLSIIYGNPAKFTSFRKKVFLSAGARRRRLGLNRGQG